LATKKIRVYELARELGVENQVVLDLAERLKIGVKSHSSSIDDPSADRVRRLADSEGLRREPIVDEPEPEAKPKRGAARAGTTKTTSPAEPAADDLAPVVTIEAPTPALVEVVAAEQDEPPAPLPDPTPHRVVRSTGVIPDMGAPAPRPAPAPAPVAPTSAPVAPPNTAGSSWRRPTSSRLALPRSMSRMRPMIHSA